MSEKTTIGELMFTVSRVLSPDKCAKLIAVSERAGYAPAEPTIVTSAKRFPGVRRCSWLRRNQLRWAMTLWRKLWELTPEYRGLRPVTVDGGFTFLRFAQGEACGWHQDPQIVGEGGEKSWLTLRLFLNDDYDGGATNFLEATVKPETGAALLYPHDRPHEDKVVVRGTKYVLQTAVLYEDPAGTTDETLPVR